MTKFFGEYLVEKDLISEKELLEALVEQVKTLPSILEVVYSQNLINGNDLISALKKQTQMGGEFVSACRELNLWTRDIETAVQREINKNRVPLGKVLIKKNKIDVKQLVSALDEFLADRIDDYKTAKSSATEKVVERSKSTTTQASDFAKLFNSDKHMEYEALIFAIEPATETYLKKLEDLIGRFEELKSFAENCQLLTCAEILNDISQTLLKFSEKGRDFEESLIWEFKADAKGALDTLLSISQWLSENKTENDFLKIEINKKSLGSLSKDWNSLREKLSKS